jgi:hypothetical protein
VNILDKVVEQEKLEAAKLPTRIPAASSGSLL